MRQNERGNPPYWYLAGLVSYGPSPCGKLKSFHNFKLFTNNFISHKTGMQGWPGVYTRVRISNLFSLYLPLLLFTLGW
jgi:hypothetical protein